MNLVKILISLFFVVLGGCATSNDGVKVANLSPQHSDLLASLDFKGSPYYKATLKRGKALYDGQALAQNTVRISEINELCKILETKLSETNLFSSVKYEGKFDFFSQFQDNEILLVLECEETHSYDRMANATSAGLTGFFTLGLAPTNLKHGFESKMTIKCYKTNGEVKSYESLTTVDAIATAYQNEFGSKGNLAVQRARHQVSINNTAYLIHQMLQDHEYFNVSTK